MVLHITVKWGVMSIFYFPFVEIQDFDVHMADYFHFTYHIVKHYPCP